MTTTDPTLDRLLRHMAWANAAIFDVLAAGSDEDLALAAPRNEWPAGRILAHLVNAAGWLRGASRGAPARGAGGGPDIGGGAGGPQGSMRRV